MELWRLIHVLFGYHYVVYLDKYIRRVRYTPIGEPYIRIAGNVTLIFGPNRSWFRPFTTKSLDDLRL